MTRPSQASSFCPGILLALLLSVAGTQVCRSQGKTTFQDHVFPLIETHCAKCHNSDKKKGDLDLSSQAGVLKGGASGAAVVSGNPDSSKLWKVVTHAEEPLMPPNKPRLSDKDLAVFKKWIADGLLETSGSKAVAATQPAVDLTLEVTDEGKPAGEPAMPKGLSTDPVFEAPQAGPVLSISSSPWAPIIAIAGQKQVLLYHSESLDRLGVLPYTNGQIHAIGFSRSGKLVFASGGIGGKSGRTAIWDVASGKAVGVVGAEFDSILASDISPDQSQLALGGPGRVLKLHSLSTGEAEHKIKKHTDWLSSIAYSPNGKMLATADRNGSIHVWDPENAQELFALAGHNSTVRALAWRRDSKILASCSEDGTLKTWELESGKQVKSWVAHEGGATGLAFSRDGLIASCGRNGKVRTWDIDGGKKVSMQVTDEFPLCVTFTHDGQRLAASTFSGKVLVWSARDGKVVGQLDAYPTRQKKSLAAR
ncbi:MAG: hypothetical protein FJ405_17975 [Verrucomicrobia bacterium]|nr:hypothetical protein [Verrucomicrobiota bacterium]